MYQVGDHVLYGIHGVCRIAGLEQRIIDRKRVEYFILEPVNQVEARFYVPTGNPAALSKLRKVLNREELDRLLCSAEACQDCWIPDDNQRRNRYRELISSGDRAALLAMVGTLYRHKEEQAAAGRKFYLCDENFLRDAQKLLESEFSLVLGIEPAQVGPYVLQKLNIE